MVNREDRGLTGPDGELDVPIDPCTSDEDVLARPEEPHYAPQEEDCQPDELTIELEDRPYAEAFIKGEADYLPYADNIARLFADGPRVWTTTSQDVGPVAAALNDASFASAFSDVMVLSRDLAKLALEDGQLDWAKDLGVLSLDVGFRSVGLNPAAEDAPLIAFSQENGGFEPTNLGLDALQALDPDSVRPDPKVPLYYTDQAIERAAAISKLDLPLSNPTEIESFEEYFRELGA